MAKQSNIQLRVGIQKRILEAVISAGLDAGLQQAFEITTSGFIRSIASQVDYGVAAGLIEYVEILDKVYRSRPFATANNRIGELMRNDVSREFQRQLKSSAPGRRKSGPYRIGRGRIGSDSLQNALMDPETIGIAGPKSIVVADTVKLDHAAKFWRRLNYGSASEVGEGPAMPTRAPKKYVRADGSDFIRGTLNVPDLRSEYVAFLPRGVWFNQSGEGVDPRRGRISSSDMFYPGKSGRYAFRTPSGNLFAIRTSANLSGGRASKTNQGWYFLNVAFSSYAKNAPALYEQIIQDQIRRALKSSKGSKFKEPSGLLKPNLNNIFKG